MDQRSAPTTRSIPARSSDVPLGLKPATASSAVTAAACPGPDLDQGRAAGGEQPRQVGHNRPIGVEPVRTAVERNPRVMVADIRLEAGDGRGLDVGRVRDHDIEGSRSAGRAPGSLHHEASRREPIPGQVDPGDRTGRGGTVDAPAEGAGPLAQQRAKDRPGPGAEIENAAGPAGVAADALQGGRDQRLRVGPRVEDRGRDDEVETPELAAPEDPRDRLPGETPGQKGLDAGRGLGVETQIRIAQERHAVEAGRGAHQDPGIRLLFGNAGLAQGQGGAADQRANRHRHAAAGPRRRARPSRAPALAAAGPRRRGRRTACRRP